MQSSILSNKCSVKLFEIVLYCILCPVTRSPKRLYSDFDIYLIIKSSYEREYDSGVYLLLQF